MDLRHAELRKAYRWRWLLSINVVWGYRSMKINRGVCFFHMTQRTHTNVNRMQSKCETFKRFAQTLEHLFDKSHIENQCNAKSMQNLFTFLLHVPGLIGNNSFSARYSRTKQIVLVCCSSETIFLFCRCLLGHAGYCTIAK